MGWTCASRNVRAVSRQSSIWRKTVLRQIRLFEIGIALAIALLLNGCVEWFWGDLRTDGAQYAEVCQKGKTCEQSASP